MITFFTFRIFRRFSTFICITSTARAWGECSAYPIHDWWFIRYILFIFEISQWVKERATGQIQLTRMYSVRRTGDQTLNGISGSTSRWMKRDLDPEDRELECIREILQTWIQRGTPIPGPIVTPKFTHLSTNCDSMIHSDHYLQTWYKQTWNKL